MISLPHLSSLLVGSWCNCNMILSADGRKPWAILIFTRPYIGRAARSTLLCIHCTAIIRSLSSWNLFPMKREFSGGAEEKERLRGAEGRGGTEGEENWFCIPDTSGESRARRGTNEKVCASVRFGRWPTRYLRLEWLLLRLPSSYCSLKKVDDLRHCHHRLRHLSWRVSKLVFNRMFPYYSNILFTIFLASLSRRFQHVRIKKCIYIFPNVLWPERALRWLSTLAH